MLDLQRLKHLQDEDSGVRELHGVTMNFHYVVASRGAVFWYLDPVGLD